MKRKPLSRRLFDRLRKDYNLDIPEDAVPRRTYAGSNQRCQGAWAWFVHSEANRIINMGSQWSIGEIMKSKELDVNVDTHGDTHIDPVFPHQKRA